MKTLIARVPGPPDQTVFRELLRTGLPIFAELLLVSLFVMADMALLKPCGTVAIAAVGLTAEPVNLIEFAFFALQTAVIASTAGCFAKNETADIGRIFVAYLKLCTLAIIVIAVLAFLFAEPFLRLFGAREDTLPIAAAYLRVTLVALVFRRIYGAVTAVLKGIGSPQWSFLLNLLANAVNILFDVLLIYGIGPFPKLGPVGAAAATAIACLAGLVCSAFIARRKLRQFGIVLTARDWTSSSWNEIKNICRDTAPMLGEKIMVRVGVFLSVQRIALLGAAQFAVHRIVISLQYFSFLSAEAISTTVLIFASRAFAKRDREEARRYVSAALCCGTGLAVFFSCAYYFGASALMGLYSADERVISAGAEVLKMIAVFQPFQAVALIYAGAMRSCGYAKIPSLVTSVGIVVIRPALIYLMTPSLGVYGAWIAISCDEIFRMFVLLTQRKRLWLRYDAVSA
ncbi:MAG TPA: MATE family efflux transporter [Feifaniaceae bacterium]|nr:MATE family efflux transporter [Feifaniaceae bacterium]